MRWASFHQTKHICWGSASLPHDSGAVWVAAANHSSLNPDFPSVRDCNTWTHLRSQDKLRTCTADYAITTMNRDTTLCENGSIWGGLTVHLCRLVCLLVFFLLAASLLSWDERTCSVPGQQLQRFRLFIQWQFTVRTVPFSATHIMCVTFQ